MAFGDIGGVITELVITCKASLGEGETIAKGDAVKLTGDYTVTNQTSDDDVVFGQALAGADTNLAAIPVKVRGVCVFTYEPVGVGNDPPVVNGAAGVAGSDTAGHVIKPTSGNGKGINLKVDTDAKLVHVLL